MGSKFTPGPWHWRMAYTMRHLWCSSRPLGVSMPLSGNANYSTSSTHQLESDARLIAAAPDLYAELAAVKEWMEDCLIDRQQKGTPSRVRYDAICAALARVDQP